MKKLKHIKRDLENESVWFIIYKYGMLMPVMYLRMLMGILANLSYVPGIIYPQHIKSHDDTVDVSISIGLFYTSIQVNGIELLVQRFAGKIERINIIQDSSSQ